MGACNSKNLDHYHELSISVETEDSSQWSLVHHDEVLNTADQDKKIITGQVMMNPHFIIQ